MNKFNFNKLLKEIDMTNVNLNFIEVKKFLTDKELLYGYLNATCLYILLI